ncbi:putative oxidoreductase [Anaerolineae bacterium]|nr:putative oxidoreductase [Anaerolineae bacterium]
MTGTEARPLDGAWVAVTGASRGIGLATARLLAGAGSRVLCLARPGPRLDEAVASLGSRASALPCDLANAVDIDRAVAAIVDRVGDAPHAIVQAAGLFPLAPFEATSPADFESALQVNLLGAWRLAQPLASRMKARGSGHVVTIGSVADRTVFPGNVAYAATKFAARAVHEVMRQELRGTGVRVSLVSPGPVDTNIWDAIDPDSRPGFTPRAEMLRPEDVADAVLYVLTRAASVNVDELRLGRA